MEVVEEREEMVEGEELVALEDILELSKLEFCKNKLNLQLKYNIFQEEMERMETQANQVRAE